jgi:diguanylate cyclase (GGDEF)-like protein/PAS domain S-box-containing protein
MNGEPISTSHLFEENQQLRSNLVELERSTQLHTAGLQASEERFALAMQAGNYGLWDWDLETDEVYFSPRWKSMLGYEEDELQHDFETWANLWHPQDKDSVLATVDAYLSGKLASFKVEIRMFHKKGHVVYVLVQAFSVFSQENKPTRLVGTQADISERKKAEIFNKRTTEILEMIARGKSASEIYDAIALMYEERNPGMRCSMLELEDGKLLHGAAPSLPREYCDAVHGLQNGPDIGSCGTSTYTGEQCLVENIETDPKWSTIKDAALPHGMRCCWSEPIKNSRCEVLGAFGMYYDFPALPDENESEDLISAARLAGIVMEREQDQKRIRQLAYTDELTGLASRAHFYLYMEDLIQVSEQHGRTFSLMSIDLDDFKNVNDSLGHDAGDLLLKEISQRLKQTGREVDFITRISGDEFSIVIEDSEDVLAADYFCQRCLDEIAKPLKLSGRTLVPSCSIGIAHYPDDGKTLATLLKAADTALYSAKEHGKNGYAFYEPRLTEKAEYRFKFEQYLREAIEKQQLTLVYQPQIDTVTGSITGVEALSRWHHPELGQVSPVEFIATAERIGMIKPLTDWVLNSACKQAVAWKKKSQRSLRLAVNISPGLFLNDDLVQSVKQVIDKTGMDPTELELEVTESVVQTDQENLSIFRDLKKLGVSLAIDDFGTGYSSFASLKHLDADCLKIDKYFIDDLLLHDDTKLLVSSMVEIGHNFCHKVIAEGVEQPEQFEFIQKIGCESVQGYLFSKPVCAEEITTLLDKNFLV